MESLPTLCGLAGAAIVDAVTTNESGVTHDVVWDVVPVAVGR